jgi:tripartite-type tricarboxylate transporter receptor subunit TctC
MHVRLSSWRWLLVAAMLIAASPSNGLAQASGYPARQITIIAPFTPGTPADVSARRLGQSMGEVSGSPW